jgi:hypothetical protein
MSSVFPLLLLTVCSPAQDTQGHEDTQATGWRYEFAPAEVLYPAYVADPRRPVFALTMIDALDSDIPAAGDSRYGVRMGAQFAILDLIPPGDPSGGLQLAGHVGFLGQFDRDNSADNLGWDGLYGFHLAWRARPDLVVRLGMAHDSSHLGDEYIENTGATRIEYTRQEYLAGMRFAPWKSLGTYAEFGWGYDLRNEDLMEEGRVQFGLELELEPMLWNRRVAPFAALDVSAYEEDDWEENLTVQVGLVHPTAGGGRWRLGLEYYDGRSPIGEHFQDRERHVAWGVWLDL